jgi:hypothetical protein
LQKLQQSLWFNVAHEDSCYGGSARFLSATVSCAIGTFTNGRTVEKTECVPLFKVEWTQPEGKTVDELTACADGKLLASHTFTAPAFRSAPSERTTWRYQGQIDKDLISDLSKILHRKDISGLPTQVELGVGVPNYVLREQDQVARFSISQEKREQKSDSAEHPWCVLR